MCALRDFDQDPPWVYNPAYAPPPPPHATPETDEPTTRHVRTGQLISRRLEAILYSVDIVPQEFPEHKGFESPSREMLAELAARVQARRPTFEVMSLPLVVHRMRAYMGIKPPPVFVATPTPSGVHPLALQTMQHFQKNRSLLGQPPPVVEPGAPQPIPAPGVGGVNGAGTDVGAHPVSPMVSQAPAVSQPQYPGAPLPNSMPFGATPQPPLPAHHPPAAVGAAHAPVYGAAPPVAAVSGGMPAPVYGAQAPVSSAQAPAYGAQAPVYGAQAPVYGAQAPVSSAGAYPWAAASAPLPGTTAPGYTGAPLPYAPPPVAASPQGALPEPWREHKTGDGRSYYHNLVTNVTTWERPGAAQQPSLGAAVPGAVAAGVPAPGAGPTPAQPAPGLPAGWIECLSKDGKKYYCNRFTGMTQWEFPDAK